MNGGAGKTTSSFQDREFYGFYNWSEAKKSKVLEEHFQPKFKIAKWSHYPKMTSNYIKRFDMTSKDLKKPQMTSNIKMEFLTKKKTLDV